MPQGVSFVEAPLRQRCTLPPPRTGEDVQSPAIVISTAHSASPTGDTDSRD